MAPFYCLRVHLVKEIWAAAFLGLMLCTVASGAGFEVVAVTGQQAAGAEAGVFFEDLLTAGIRPHFNETGQVMFAASLAGANVDADNDGGLWLADSNLSNVSLLARQGDQAPGVPAGVIFGPDAFLKRPPFMGTSVVGNLNDAGQYLYWADLAGTGVDDTNDAGLWSGTTSADATLVARTGDQAAGFENGIVYNNLLRGAPVMNATGEIAFSGQVRGTGISHLVNDDAIWRGTPASFDLFLQADTAAPGTTEKFRSHYSNGFGMLMDDQGQMQVWSWLTENGTDQVVDWGLWTGDSAANLTLLARTGDPAPGFASGVVLGSPFLRPTTTSGQSIFAAKMSGPGISPGNQSAVWVDDAVDGLELIVQRGDPDFPGSGGNLTFEVFTGVELNESGTFVIRTQYDHVSTGRPAVVGILMGTSAEDLSLLAGADQPVPGLDPSWRIYNTGGLDINNAGQVVFGASIKESALSRSSIGQGIWGYDPVGGVELLFKSGDQLEIATGDWRTIDRILLFSGSSLADGTRRGLTEDGEFLFHAEFTDGSEGLFVGSIAVPEPGNLTMLGFGTFLLLARKRRSGSSCQTI